MTRNAPAFSVAKSTYRSSNIVPIRLDPMKYPDTVPMDWSSDGKSILFSYQSKQDDGSAVPKLSVLSLDNMTLSTLETNFGPYPAKYSSDGSKLVLLIDSNLYAYDLGTNTTAKLTSSSDVLSFDVASDGRLLYTASANLVMTNSDGSNPTVVFHSDSEYETYTADIASDGSKVLLRKVISASYGGQDAVLAYYDLEEKEHIVPNIHIGCGSPPKWAPNSFHIIFHESSCSRGWPGGILRITDQNVSLITMSKRSRSACKLDALK